MRLINADALKYRREDYGGYDDVGDEERKRGILYLLEKDIAAAQTIEPVKHGTWKLLPSEVVSDDGLWGETRYVCSNCGKQRHFPYPYCPICGAKMDVKEQKSYADWVVKRE